MNALTPLQTLALAKLIPEGAEKAARAAIQPGHYIVEFDAHVAVDMTVGEDFRQRIVLKADPWTLLAAALSHLNDVTIDSLVREAISADPKLVESIKEKAKLAMDTVHEATWTDSKGKATFDRKLVEAADGAVERPFTEADAPVKPPKAKRAKAAKAKPVKGDAPSTGLASVFDDEEE
ncbi:hypothetical protein UFOVP1382_5 [uncultured Caudovirales phage]|uniref:Uncharacterized protein n=1 Tax=uncultured Caudovirales phage TaxID=2100421 RepID=A0A6J5RX86_9CAUD|nr:hypothetical protein UFOVP1382_5 [uncultured Caudovirales phage]